MRKGGERLLQKTGPSSSSGPIDSLEKCDSSYIYQDKWNYIMVGMDFISYMYHTSICTYKNIHTEYLAIEFLNNCWFSKHRDKVTTETSAFHRLPYMINIPTFCSHLLKFLVSLVP